ncbi:MAG: MoaD/ThiS family protein [Promethearchaeota archaeon]
MVKVKLHLLNIFHLRINKRTLEYDGNTVGSIISQFIKEYGDKLDDELLDKKKQKLNTHILILLNGRNIKYLKNYKTNLKNGDELYFSYPLSGG